MPALLVAAANIEWMNNWFSGDAGAAVWRSENKDEAGTFVPREAARRASAMLRAIDPDILAIEEGPSRPEEMALFIQDYLSDGNGAPLYQFVMGTSGAAQKLALLYKPQWQVALLPGPQVASLTSTWDADVDGDMKLETYKFTRQPLTVDANVGGERLRIIVMHTKSNFVNRGEQLWHDDQQKYVEAALMNRRRISSEGMRVRRYLDELVGADLNAKVLVMGDLNDGPGMDYFEGKYLSHNVTDILLGSAFEPEFTFAHAQHDVPSADRYSAVFDDFVENVPSKRLLLDHILVSPGLALNQGLRKVTGSGKVHHQEWQAQVQGSGTKRDARPSDHRPVSVRLET